MNKRKWQYFWWSLFFVWVACAILGMNHINAGLLTSYGADLTLPAWLYIAARSLHFPENQSLLRRYIGFSPDFAAISIFLASTATEVSQFYFPDGPFPGVFDYFDILAYATGTGICYILDRQS